MPPVETVDLGVSYDAAQEAQSYALLPNGPRTFQVESVDDDGKSAAGNAKFKYKLKLLNPPKDAPPTIDGVEQKWPDRIIVRMNASPKTDWAWKTFFKACGKKWTGTKLDPNAIVGTRVIGDVIRTEYQGRVRNEIAPGGFHPMKTA
jgi:hypothetical protein